ncbi:hypothetical protein Q73A0000_10095 [Kaistella flava (ex Peng et al. 2021)]|uniref:CBM-cenC domain-containing protein n=1 Tax=Kaistella flava (ex Peng et al. 2021) TaxID=2038776 RepID=A0A7M2Y985_9FLAO|nr:hypothetical protein [Kaistella flava (ex Peng et al. 2021)]QOW10701.1 hypothetical protein Q73A0000_10095 [Kaistella flava (ex Peng et al. 2021)]
MKKYKLITALVLLISITFSAQNGYIYVHKKAISEVVSLDFPFSLTGPSSYSKTFTLNDKPDNLNAFDLGNSHGAGEGQLWAVINNGSAAGSTHVTNGVLYTRLVNAPQWTAKNTGVTDVRSVDGIDANTAVYCNSSGTVYTYNAVTNVATSIGKPATIIDVASGGAGGVIVAVGSNGTLYKYSGTGTSWTPYSGTNVSNVYRVDVNPTNQDIVFIRTGANQAVYRLPGGSAASAIPVTISAPAGTSSAGDSLRDVAVSNNGTIYANYNNAASSANIFEYTSSWVDNPTSRSFSGITAGAGNQSWAINKVNPDQINHSIFSSTILSTSTSPGLWLDDERVRTTFDGNTIMIPVPAGTYTLKESASSGWSNSEIKIYDPTGDSSSDVTTLTSTIKVAAGEVVNVVYSNSLLNSINTPASCGTNYLLTFGTGEDAYAPAIKGFTSYHYRGSEGVSDGYYAVVKNKNDWYTTTPALINHTPTNQALPGDPTTNPPDPNGYYAIFNASYATDDFFRQTVTGLAEGTSYQFAFWVADLSPGNPIRPNVTMGVNDASGVLINSITTGDITDTNWGQYTFNFTATTSTVEIFLKNNSIGGLGNDIAIDDVSFAPTPPALPISTGLDGVAYTLLCSDPSASYQFVNTQTDGIWSTNTLDLITISATGLVTTKTGASGVASIIYSYYNAISGCTSTTTLYITVGVCGCYNDPATGTGADSQHGITLLQRAGADNGNWPMIRKSALTVLESNTKGFVITRMTTAQVTAIVAPQEGMMVYDTTLKCLKLYDGTAWSCFNTPACP